MAWWFGRKAAPDMRPLVPDWLSGEARDGFDSGYAAQVDEVFRRNPVGQRSVRLVAGMLGGLPVHATTGDVRAAAIVNADGLLEGIAANLLLHGNAFVQLVGGDEAGPELVQLRPERVSVVADDRGWPVAYLYRAAGQAVERPAGDDRGAGSGCRAAAGLDDSSGIARRSGPASAQSGRGRRGD